MLDNQEESKPILGNRLFWRCFIVRATLPTRTAIQFPECLGNRSDAQSVVADQLERCKEKNWLAMMSRCQRMKSVAF